MKVILETQVPIDLSIQLSNDDIDIYRVNTDNIFDETWMVLDKYSIILQQMHYKNWVFINSIFSFLLNLKKGSDTLYFRKLHNSLVESFKSFLRHNDYIIFVYEAKPEIIEYLEEYSFQYEIIWTSKDLISKLNNIF